MHSRRIRHILKKVCETVQKLMDFDRFYVVLYDPRRSILQFPLVNDQGKQSDWPERNFQKDTLPDLLMEKGKTIRIRQDTIRESNHLRYWPDSDLPQSWLGVPLVVDDSPIGALVVENYLKAEVYGSRESDLLSTIARQTAMAIENARQRDRLERQRDRFRVLHELGISLNDNIQRNEKEICELIYQNASQLMDTDNMYIALYEADPDKVDQYNEKNPEENILNGTIHFHLMYEDGKERPPWSRKPVAGQYGRTEVILCTKKEIFNKTRAESQAWYKKLGHKEFIGKTFASWLGVPVMIGGNLLGVIATYHSTDDYVYNEDDLQVLSMMADAAAAAFNNAKLYRQLEDANRQLEDKVQERTRQLEDANRQLEDKVQERTRQLEDANRQLEDANRQLEDKVQERTRQLEDANRQLEDKVQERTRELRELNEQLEDKVQERTRQKEALTELLSLNDLAGRFVHKINNLVGNIPIDIDYMKDSLVKKGVDETTYEDLNNISEQISYLVQMARRVQKSTRKLQESKQSKIFQKADAIVLLDKALNYSLGLNEEKMNKFSIQKDYRKKTLYIETFESLFVEALDNLISNAFDAMPEGGKLVLGANTCQMEGTEYAVLTIADSGKGIPEKDHHRIYNIDYSKKSGGLGYGLWSVKRICDATATKIHFSSKENTGTSFSLYIPLLNEGENQ